MYEWKRGVKLKGDDGRTPIEGVDFVIPKAIKGEDGKTPIKGTDYFTDEEISSIKESITPVKGRDYFDGNNGSPDTGFDIVDKISKLEGDDRLSFDVLKDTPTFQQLRRDISSRDYDLVELKDVSVSSPSNGQVLKYNSSTGKWGNGTDSSNAPGGANKQAQFNQDGIFGTDPLYTYDKDTQTLSVVNFSANLITDATWDGDVITMDKGGTGQNLNDPGADSLMGWDEADGAIGFWSLGNGLVYDTVGNSLSVDDTVFLSIADANTNYLRLDGTNDPITGDVTFNDNVDLEFGSVASLRWDTADANANFLKLNLPTPGAVDLAGLMLGVGISGVDTALFNGITQTFLGGFNAADDNEYWYHTYNPTSGFGGTGGQAEWISSGDMLIEIGGSLAGTSGMNVRPPSGVDKLMRVSYRGGGTATTCRFEFGEQGATGVFFFHDGSFDQSGWGLTTLSGRQMIISDSANWTNSRDFDIPVMTDPILVVGSSLNVNTDNGEIVSICADGMRGGAVTTAAWTTSTFAMETDRAPKNFTVGAASARQNASSQTNKTGGTYSIRAGNGNILDSTSGIGGNIDLYPGSQDDDNNGEPGRVRMLLPQTTNFVRVGGVLETNTTEVGNVGVGEDNLMTYTLPGFSLQKTGDSVRIRAAGVFAANANNKNVKLYFGASVIVTTGALGFNGTEWSIDAIVMRDGATAQKASGNLITNDALLPVTTNYIAPGETMTGNITIKCTGEGTSNNDIVQEMFIIEYLPAN